MRKHRPEYLSNLVNYVWYATCHLLLDMTRRMMLAFQVCQFYHTCVVYDTPTCHNCVICVTVLNNSLADYVDIIEDYCVEQLASCVQ